MRPSRADLRRSRRGVRIGLILTLVVASLAFPGNAGAQRPEIVRVLTDLRASLEGSYGDEGPEIARLIGALPAAATNSDQSILASDSPEIGRAHV